MRLGLTLCGSTSKRNQSETFFQPITINNLAFQSVTTKRNYIKKSST